MRAKHLSISQTIAAMVRFSNDPIAALEYIHQRHGDFVTAQLGNKKLAFCYHPSLAKKVFSEQAHSFRKSRLIFDQIIPLTGDKGLVQMEGQEGLLARRMTVQAFTDKSMDIYLKRFATNFVEFQEQLAATKTGQLLDLELPLSRLILRNALSMVIGPSDKINIDELLHVFLEINKLCGAEIRRKTSLGFLYRRSRSKEIGMLEKRLSVLTQKIIFSQPPGSESLLGHLQNAGVAPSQIEQHVRTFLFAGFETTTTSIMMTLYLIARHAEVKHRLTSTVEDQNLTSIPTLKKMDLLTNVYQEALRLYPPSWTLAREATENVTIGDESVASGSLIFFGLPQIHRHPDFWDEPQVFKPDRFDAKSPEPFSYLPFGAGNRICIGMHAAKIEANFVIASLLQNFAIEVPENFRPKMVGQITAHPTNGLPVYLRKAA